MWLTAWATARHLTGLALVAGTVIFGVGAALYMRVRDKGGPVIFGQPPAVWLRLVHTHPRLWRWATVPFAAGVPVVVLAQTELALLLRAAGDPGWAALGLVATLFGAVPWLLTLASRLVVDPWAGERQAATGAVPEIYEPLARWNTAFFVIYTIMTFTGLVAFGLAFLATTVLPGWFGWVAIVYGVAGLVLLATTRDAPPFVHYLMTLAIGILLLVG
ncbi:MAG TPA: hypothetical protein VGR57_17675 [Ktedonobacterales bacterium]|nr:hypothetical protein [Ktedonobacterales bacterium]